MVIQNKYCENCFKEYTDIKNIWCKLCQKNWLKENFANWTSGNEEIDCFIQGMQLEINNYNNIIVEWIPYDQFDDIKKIGKNKLATFYSAKWKDGPLEYNNNTKKCERKPNSVKEITIKYFHNIQDISEFLYEV
jgi:hypothetical protein